MAKRSAGLLIHRRSGGDIQVLLVHPGGPFWAKKDDGTWSIPKGLVDEGEDQLAAARRETEEELGVKVEGPFSRLGDYRQPGGKTVTAWSVEADIDVAAIRSNIFTMEWPPRSGRMKEFPEVDRAGWFTLAEAEVKMLAGQRPMVVDLAERLGAA